MKKRKLFCEISPTTYKISQWKERTKRNLKDIFCFEKFANEKSDELLPVIVYKHNSLIRRVLGNVDLELQENKATNLALASPHVSGILIKPQEIFSFWRLVGECSEDKGYKKGLTISLGETSSGIGGGMCQFTNLIHWLVLHTPLEIVEHHHHDGLDLFPDYGRQVPFGTGTSILYNHKDYRFKNNTKQVYQLIVYVKDKYLCGEIRTTVPLPIKFHIYPQKEYFITKEDGVYRVGQVMRSCVDKKTGNVIQREIIKHNYAKVMYDTTGLDLKRREQV